MSAQKKCVKNKLISEELEDVDEDFGYLINVHNKKTQKRQRVETAEEKGILSKSIGKYQANNSAKNVEIFKEPRQKVLDTMKTQFNSRKRSTLHLLESLSNIIMQMESDSKVIVDNEQKLQTFVDTTMKCIEQSITDRKQKLETLKDIHASFKKKCEDLEENNNKAINKLDNVLNEDLTAIVEKLSSEAKRKHMEIMRKLMASMQYDF